jgi:leucyl-tRNA synthetase
VGAGALDRYDHRRVEAHWQAVWQQTKIYQVDVERAERAFYNLMMFPYPSAAGLHVGNIFAFTGADVYGRFMAMQGVDLFEPIGFDAFGMHSENYAIREGIHPRVLTAQSVENIRETQLKRSGNRYDWRYEVHTTDPDYYKWTQWIFVQLFKAGLAVRKKAAVNWCPSCKTVLADEQVIEGLCERCDAVVQQRQLEQWFFKITDYVQHLLENLDWLDWSEVIKTAQRNWIGRSEGLQFRLPVEGHPDAEIPVFTTRPDTVFGMTYVVLAPEHPLVERLVSPENKAAVDAYRAEVRMKSELDRIIGSREKSGEFIGAYAINPVNGERLPIWIADYVLATYGTGAIMAVPAHDERDFEFAQAFGLPIRQVIVPAESSDPSAELTEAYIGTGTMVESGPFSGSPSPEGGQKIIAWFEERDLGERTVQYRLRDWLISRQRYWGPPIPIVYCESCGTLPVPEEDLPVLLPDVEDWKPKGTGSSPLAEVASFVETICPVCGGPARRETDVSDNFLDSAWYFLRYPSIRFHDRPFDPEMTAKWLPVDMYIGGREHSVLHLLYSRFITMALHDLGYLSFEEPFTCFRAHGIITLEGAKMSKSKGNVVTPDAYYDQYGADTLRMYLMFLGPYERGGYFTDEGIGGVWRFLNRVWDLVHKHHDQLVAEMPSSEDQRRLHQTIRKVTEDVKKLKYNTAIAAMMKYLNALQSRERLCGAEVETLLLLLAPFAPHIAEQLWAQVGRPYSIHQQSWPTWDPELARPDEVEMAVQVDGRVRDRIVVEVDAAEEEIREAALAAAGVQRAIGGKPVTKIIVVPGRVVNVVTT